MKDKENTLLDIFKSMKMFIEKDVVANDNEVKTCTKTYSSQQELDSHRETHKKPTLSKCDYCDFTDKREENVKNHILAKHTKYRCHLCEYETRHGKSLDNHLTSKHFKSNFVCTDCDRLFHSQRLLKDHQRKHRNRDKNCTE